MVKEERQRYIVHYKDNVRVAFMATEKERMCIAMKESLIGMFFDMDRLNKLHNDALLLEVEVGKVFPDHKVKVIYDFINKYNTIILNLGDDYTVYQIKNVPNFLNHISMNQKNKQDKICQK